MLINLTMMSIKKVKTLGVVLKITFELEEFCHILGIDFPIASGKIAKRS